jgi:hypothetical protein
VARHRYLYHLLPMMLLYQRSNKIKLTSMLRHFENACGWSHSFWFMLQGFVSSFWHFFSVFSVIPRYFDTLVMQNEPYFDAVLKKKNAYGYLRFFWHE